MQIIAGRFASALLVLALVVACAPTTVSVSPEAGSTQQLPAPSAVLVYDFAVSPDEVQLTQGIAADVAQAMKGTPRTEQERQLGRAVADKIATEIVGKVQAMGLAASRASGPAPATGNTVLVKGQLLTIDEGNQTERVVIGFGFGRSNVAAAVQVAEATGSTVTPIEAMTVKAESGDQPGGMLSVGVGGATGRLVTSAVTGVGSQVLSETLDASASAEATRLADNVAEQLRIIFQRQGWIN